MLNRNHRRTQKSKASSTTMTTKDVTVNGKVFPCPVNWSVEEAEKRIRSRYELQGGGIEHNNVPVQATNLISSFTGTLVFVDGHQQLGKHFIHFIIISG